MHELKHYLELSEKVKADQPLMELIDAYQSETKQLMDLLQDPDYDAQEAIRLTNDVEYMSAQISQNDLYRQFAAAKDALDKALREKRSCRCHATVTAAPAAKSAIPGRNINERIDADDAPIYGSETAISGLLPFLSSRRLLRDVL